MGLKGKLEQKTMSHINLGGSSRGATAAGTSADIKVLLKDGSGDILWATGTDVPTDSTAGYAKGCLFIDRDVAAATTGLYVNVGTTAECDFDAVSDA